MVSGRTPAAARGCTCHGAAVAVAVCLGNLIAAQFVARALCTLIRGGEVFHAADEVGEESIWIRRAAEPVELIQPVKQLLIVFAREAKRRKELPLELKQKVLYEILQKHCDLGEESSNSTEKKIAGLEDHGKRQGLSG